MHQACAKAGKLDNGVVASRTGDHTNHFAGPASPGDQPRPERSGNFRRFTISQDPTCAGRCLGDQYSRWIGLGPLEEPVDDIGYWRRQRYGVLKNDTPVVAILTTNIINCKCFAVRLVYTCSVGLSWLLISQLICVLPTRRLRTRWGRACHLPFHKAVY